MLQDEANLAYQQSLVNFRMEIARIARTSYTEVNTSGTDVSNFQAGVSPLNSIHTLREVYKGDVLVLLRKGDFQIGSSTLFGEAYDQPTTNDPPNASEAFCMVTTDYLIGGRFTFAHEIGHLQGAGHDNNTESPNYARGFIQNNIIGPTRTIMATANVTGCSFNNSGCRVQYFSNPNVNFGTGPMGTVDRDNVRRMNETAPAILNYRSTSENLVVQNETFDNEILANHLGNSTVSTSGTVTASNGSWVTFRATDEITLNPGFSADNGSDFTAALINNPCTVLPPQDTTNVSAPSTTIARTVTDESADNRRDNTSIQESVRTYPNPSDNLLNIEFVLKKPAKVSLVITDLAGKVEKGISKNANYESGVHKLTVNTEKLAPGVYIYTLVLDNNRHTGKIVIVH
nr:T9SS type A sorting domain-containing protein [Paraflavitalea speifideiaquila]